MTNMGSINSNRLVNLCWMSNVIWVRLVRGAITKKKRENLGKIPKGGVEKTDENSQFQFWNFENPGGGGSRFFKNV